MSSKRKRRKPEQVIRCFVSLRVKSGQSFAGQLGPVWV
jgi:hypothetical protein